MRVAWTATVLFLAGAMTVLANDFPKRKAGLWEVRTSVAQLGGAGLTSQVCIDGATDQMTMSSAGPLTPAACSNVDVQRSGDTMTIDSTCALAGKPATSHAVIAGSFDSAYTMTVTSQSEALPGGKMNMTVTAKWLGACAADQKPGDIIMGNGLKMNILEMQKRGLSQGVPLPR